MIVCFSRCIITTSLRIIALFSVFTVVNAQQIESDLSKEFDEALPALEDNLPPNMAVEDLLKEEVSLSIEQDNIYQPIITSQMREFNSKRIELVELVNQTPQHVRINGQSYSLNNPELVSTFYQSEQFPTIWTHENDVLSQVESLKESIRDAQLDGLNPQHYHLSVIEPLLSDQSYQDIVSYELLLTDAFLSLAENLANGLVDPTHTHREWNAKKVSELELAQSLAKAYLQQDYEHVLTAFNANNPRYQALKRQYNSLLDTNNIPDDTPLPEVTLRVGMTHPGVVLLRQKLGLTDQSNYFDETLKQAVKSYQQNIGISADGVVGPGTRALLNTTHQQVIDSLLINMERQRWLPQQLGNPYILVNIPSYKVEIIQDNNVVYETKSIVGRKSRPTPAFTDRVQHIVMSPTWTVPSTIMRKDKLPTLRSNPGAFDGTYEVVTPGGQVLKPSAINWHNANASSYTLRQKPGRHNALGRIKFLFPNKYAIYLHDTPNKGLFSRANRAYSSGCVRLADPFDFAEKLLENTNWTPDKIKAASNRSTERWVNPPTETPIYLVYWTTWSDVSGHIQFAQDIYDLDAKLLKQYQQALL